MQDILQKKMEQIKKAINKRQKEGAAEKNPDYSCFRCSDRGIIYNGSEATVCSCMQQKKLENQFKHARISGEFRDKNFEDFSLDFYPAEPLSDKKGGTLYGRARECLEAGKNLVEDISAGREELRGMYIYGGVGSGKTLLAACIANELLRRGTGVLFVVVPDLLDELKSTFNSRSEKEEISLMSTIRNAPVLILDDLGVHNYSEWTAGRIYNIINYRVNQCLPTVITSNYALGEMADLLDERTTSRIIQLCRIYRLEVDRDIRVKRYLSR